MGTIIPFPACPPTAPVEPDPRERAHRVELMAHVIEALRDRPTADLEEIARSARMGLLGRV